MPQAFVSVVVVPVKLEVVVEVDVLVSEPDVVDEPEVVVKVVSPTGMQ